MRKNDEEICAHSRATISIFTKCIQNVEIVLVFVHGFEIAGWVSLALVLAAVSIDLNVPHLCVVF